MEKDKWKYVLEVRFDTDSVWNKGYDMYFSTLDQAVKRLTEIKFQDFINKATYYPFKGNQLNSVKLIDTQSGNIILETEVKQWRANWEEFDEKAPGLYLKFPQGLKDFEKKSGLELQNFKPEGNTILLGYYVGDWLKSSKPVISFEELYRKLHRGADDGFTVDYRLSGFGNGIVRTRDITEDILVEQYNFLAAEDALHKLLSTDLNKLDEYVAWECGYDHYYNDVRFAKGNTDIAVLRSQRTGILQVGSYLTQEPGVFLKIEHQVLGNQLPMPAGTAVNNGIYRLGKYNERRDGVIVSDEIVKYSSESIRSNPALGTKKGLKKALVKSPAPKGRGRKL